MSWKITQVEIRREGLSLYVYFENTATGETFGWELPVDTVKDAIFLSRQLRDERDFSRRVLDRMLEELTP